MQRLIECAASSGVGGGSCGGGCDAVFREVAALLHLAHSQLQAVAHGLLHGPEHAARLLISVHSVAAALQALILPAPWAWGVRADLWHISGQVRQHGGWFD